MADQPAANAKCSSSAMAGTVRQHGGIWYAVRKDPFEQLASATHEWADPPVKSEEEANIVRHWSDIRQSMVPTKMTSSVSLPSILQRSSAVEAELEIDELCAAALSPDVSVLKDNRDQTCQQLDAHREAIKARYDEAVDEEQAMRHRLMDLQRQLRRTRVHAAEKQRFQQQAEKGLQLRNEMGMRWGLDDSSKLKAVQPASDVEVRELSKLFNLKMGKLRELDSHNVADPKGEGRWLRMYNTIGTNGSGRIFFADFRKFIRTPECGATPGLGLAPKVLPDLLLSAMWRSIDKDATGHITAGEFGKFMRLGRLPVVPQERRVWMERTREEQRRRLEDREQRHIQEAVRSVAENTRRFRAEAERLERALGDSDQLLGSKEPLRDGRMGFRVNGSNFADGFYYGGLPSAARSAGQIGSQKSPQRSPPRRLRPMNKFQSPTESEPSADEYGFFD